MTLKSNQLLLTYKYFKAMWLVAMATIYVGAYSGELRLVVDDHEKIEKIMDCAQAQTGFALYIRLNSGRIFTLSTSWGLIADMQPSRFNMEIGFLSSMEKPNFRVLTVDEMKSACKLLIEFNLSNATKSTPEEDINRNLVRLAKLAASDELKSHRADATAVQGLALERIPEYYSILYIFMLQMKLKFLREDAPKFDAEAIK